VISRRREGIYPFSVAVATSGLGHVARGMESWAETLARELARRGVDVTLFRGAGPEKSDYDVVVPCIKRSARLARIGNVLNHVGGWRVGLGSQAQVESFSYGVRLLQHLRRGFDIVHIQQESLGLFLNRAKRLGLLKPRVVFGNGQKASPTFLERFEFIHFLSPYDLEETVKHVPKRPGWRVIPNFVDTTAFAPGDRAEARTTFGFAVNDFTIVSVGMVDKSVKRMDYLIREAASLAAEVSVPVSVAIAGSRHRDSAEIETLGGKLLGDRFSVFYDVPREKMADFCRAADVFVLCSPRESFGLVLVEAMACGIPVVSHSFPIMDWVVGDGGAVVDMTRPGALAAVLSEYVENAELRGVHASAALHRARATFSHDAVVPQIIEMYGDVLVS